MNNNSNNMVPKEKQNKLPIKFILPPFLVANMKLYVHPRVNAWFVCFCWFHVFFLNPNEHCFDAFEIACSRGNAK
ncbi:hypothetical protein VIGAN_04046900, partial [Vigna angularis var. angularis]